MNDIINLRYRENRPSTMALGRRRRIFLATNGVTSRQITREETVSQDSTPLFAPTPVLKAYRFPLHFPQAALRPLKGLLVQQGAILN